MNRNDILEGISAVCFDLDNTLYDQNLFLVPVYRKMAAYIRKTGGASEKKVFEFIRRLAGKKFSNYPSLFEECAAHFGLREPRVIAEFLKIYRTHDPKKLRPYPGVSALLGRLRRRTPLAVITNGHAPTQKKKLKALGLSRFFSKVVYADLLGEGRKRRKPHPAPYQEVLKHFKISGPQLLYVGDNPYVDFPGAVRLKIKCARVLTGEYKAVKTPALLSGRVETRADLKAFFGD